MTGKIRPISQDIPWSTAAMLASALENCSEKAPAIVLWLDDGQVKFRCNATNMEVVWMCSRIINDFTSEIK